MLILVRMCQRFDLSYGLCIDPSDVPDLSNLLFDTPAPPPPQASSFTGPAVQTCQQGEVVHLCVALVLYHPDPAATGGGKERGVKCDYVYCWSSASGNADFHNSFMRMIAKRYKKLVPGLTRIKVLSDGCPSQYKCRQNFWQLAKQHETNDVGVKFEQHFACAHHGSGPHDNAGKVVRHFIQNFILSGGAT